AYMNKRNLAKPLLKDEEFEANKKDIETIDAKKPFKIKRGLTVHISFRELSIHAKYQYKQCIRVHIESEHMCFRYVNMFRKDGDHDRYKECTYVLLEGVKDKQENDKIETKPDKNGKRGEAGKSQKQLQ
nr:embryo sac development arrest 7 [Tanacetum cinerariifolium]